MAIVTDGLVLYLHGACGKNNPATRVWKDLSGNGNDGELINFGYTEDSGWVDGGLKFDGVDDYVQLPDLNLNPDNFTIQVDNKIRAFNGDKVITENGDKWGRNLLKGNTNNEPVLVEVNNNYYKEYRTDIVLEVGQTYTFSWDYDIKTTNQTLNIAVGAGENVYLRDIRSLIPIEEGKVTFTVEESHLERGHRFFYRLSRSAKPNTSEVEYRSIKLEKGSTATPWTPAPEDITETNIINHTTPFVENNTIHTFRLYNRALTDEEIMQNYQAGHEWTPQIGKREVTTTMKPITTSLSRKSKGKRELISTMKPITTSLERKGKGKREVITTMKPITSELSRKGVGRREVISIVKPITTKVTKKLPPIHANITAKERTPNITTRERIPKLEVD